MKKLFIKSVFLAIPLFIVLGIIEYKLGNIENSYSIKKKNLQEVIETIEILNLGSSHAYMGIDPSSFSFKGFNMANVSQSFFYDYKLLEKYIDKASKLKIVLLPVSYFSFGFSLSDNSEYWRCYFYERYEKLPIENNANLINMKRCSMFALYGNKESLNYILKLFKVNLAENINKNGAYLETNYDTNLFKNSISDSLGKIRTTIHDKTFSIDNTDDNYKYVEKIIKLCKQKNVTPVLITTPVYQTYYKNMNPEIWNATQDLIDKLSAEYGIKYYNYLKDSRFTIEHFRDNDHLNPAGARMFSSIINDEILKRISLFE